MWISLALISGCIVYFYQEFLGMLFAAVCRWKLKNYSIQISSMTCYPTELNNVRIHKSTDSEDSTTTFSRIHVAWNVIQFFKSCGKTHLCSVQMFEIDIRWDRKLRNSPSRSAAPKKKGSWNYFHMFQIQLQRLNIHLRDIELDIKLDASISRIQSSREESSIFTEEFAIANVESHLYQHEQLLAQMIIPDIHIDLGVKLESDKTSTFSIESSLEIIRMYVNFSLNHQFQVLLNAANYTHLGEGCFQLKMNECSIYQVASVVDGIAARKITPIEPSILPLMRIQDWSIHRGRATLPRFNPNRVANTCMSSNTIQINLSPADHTISFKSLHEEVVSMMLMTSSKGTTATTREVVHQQVEWTMQRLNIDIAATKQIQAVNVMSKVRFLPSLSQAIDFLKLTQLDPAFSSEKYRSICPMIKRWSELNGIIRFDSLADNDKTITALMKKGDSSEIEFNLIHLDLFPSTDVARPKFQLFGNVLAQVSDWHVVLALDQYQSWIQVANSVKTIWRSPSSSDSSSGKQSTLMWWDNLRCNYYGQCAFSCEKLSARWCGASMNYCVESQDVDWVGNTNEMLLHFHQFSLMIVQHEKTLSVPFLELPRLEIKTICHWTCESGKDDVEIASSTSSDLALEMLISFQNHSSLSSSGATFSPSAASFPKMFFPRPSQGIIAFRWDLLFPLFSQLWVYHQERKQSQHQNPLHHGRHLLSILSKLECYFSTEMLQCLWYDDVVNHVKSLFLLWTDLKTLAVFNKDAADSWAMSAVDGKWKDFRAHWIEKDSSLDTKRAPELRLYLPHFPLSLIERSNFFIQATEIHYARGFQSSLPSFDQLTTEWTPMLQIPTQITKSQSTAQHCFDFQINHARFQPASMYCEKHQPESRSNISKLKSKSTQRRLLSYYVHQGFKNAEHTDSEKTELPIHVDSMKFLWTLSTRDDTMYLVQRLAKDIQTLAKTKSKRSSTEKPAINIQPVSTTSSATLFDLLNQGKFNPDSRNNIPISVCTKPKSPRNEYQHRKKSHVRDAEPANHGIPPMSHGSKILVSISALQLNIQDERSSSSMIIVSSETQLVCLVHSEEASTSVDLTFEKVTSYVAPTDVDVAAGVQWFEPQHSLLKQVLSECQIHCSSRNSHALSDFQMDLSSFVFTLDRNQFQQVVSVIQHVLLAPPVQDVEESSPILDQSPWIDDDDYPSTAPTGPASKPVPTTHRRHLASPVWNHKRKKLILKELFEHLQHRPLQQNQAGSGTTNPRSRPRMTKIIHYTIPLGKLRLNIGPEFAGISGISGYDFAEICIRGVEGTHTFYENGKICSEIQLQWLEVNNLRPGPSSIGFDDAVTILKPRLSLDHHHRPADDSMSSIRPMERLLRFRAESHDKVNMGQYWINVYDVLEISFFPGVSSVLEIQLAKDLYDLLSKFFYLSNNSHSDEDAEDPKYADNAFCFGSSSPGSPMSSSNKPKRRKSLMHHFRRPSFDGTMDPENEIIKTGVVDEEEVSSGEEEESNDEDEHVIISSPSNSKSTMELSFFKYLRIGRIHFRINCHGFLVNLRQFELDLPPFVRHQKLWTNRKCIKKFETHLKWYITKETATSGLSSIFRSSAKGVLAKTPHMKKNEHILFGAYHKSHSGSTSQS